MTDTLPHSEDADAIRFYELTGITPEEYERSFGNRAKQAWIVFQSCMMFFFMYRGFKCYNKVTTGWSKVKTLFVVQAFCVSYLGFHEFTGRSIKGFYLILLFTSYGLFLTFSVVVDSC